MKGKLTDRWHKKKKKKQLQSSNSGSFLMDDVSQEEVGINDLSVGASDGSVLHGGSITVLRQETLLSKLKGTMVLKL